MTAISSAIHSQWAKFANWETLDRLSDYTPFISTVKSLYILFQKHALIPFLDKDKVQKSPYYTYMKNTDTVRSVTLLIPILGNILVFFYDKDKSAAKEALQKQQQIEKCKKAYAIFQEDFKSICLKYKESTVFVLEADSRVQEMQKGLSLLSKEEGKKAWREFMKKVAEIAHNPNDLQNKNVKFGRLGVEKEEYKTFLMMMNGKVFQGYMNGPESKAQKLFNSEVIRGLDLQKETQEEYIQKLRTSWYRAIFENILWVGSEVSIKIMVNGVNSCLSAMGKAEGKEYSLLSEKTIKEDSLKELDNQAYTWLDPAKGVESMIDIVVSQFKLEGKTINL
jgi:hypothetical protein